MTEIDNARIVSLSAQLAAEKARADKAEGERDEAREGGTPEAKRLLARALAAEANLLTATKAREELRRVLHHDLNVTDEELLRIRNGCNCDGDVKIWARMLQKLVDAVRQARALSPESKDKGNG